MTMYTKIVHIRKYNYFVVSALEQSPALTSEKTINIILVCGIVAAVVLITVAGSLAIKKVTEKRYGKTF